jgi:hypothetical protein
MNENLLLASIFWSAIVASAIEGYFRPIHHFLARLSSTLRQRQRHLEAANRQYIVDLVRDKSFFLMETVRAFAKAILYTLLLIFLWLLSRPPGGWIIEVITVSGWGFALWAGYQVSIHLSLVNQAREYYREDLEIEAELGPDFDETAYLLKSPANVAALERSLQQYETGQHISLDLDL